MGLFDEAKKFVNRATGGLFEGVDYGSFYNEQSGLYKEELIRRSKQFAASETLNSNAASIELLKKGNRPLAPSNAKGVDFQKLQDEFAMRVSNTSIQDVRSGSSTAGLTGDSLKEQKRVDAQIVDTNYDQYVYENFGIKR